MVARARQVFVLFLPLGAGVAMLAGGLLSLALMLLSVGQRTAEIGLRRTVGATPRDIALEFIAETTLTTLLGGFGGVLVGFGAALLVAKRMGIEGVWSWQTACLGILLSAGLGLLAGVLPARRAALLQPVDALR